MKLIKLFEAQRKLDEHIEREHPRQDGEDRLAKKIFALLVELGELANEWRGFKYWSNNQEPRTRHVEPDIEHFDKTREARWKESNPLLEEYVDCLHFILSIGLEIEVSDEDIEIALEIKENQTSQNTFDQFVLVINWANSMHDDNYYHELLASFIVLGEMLGFTWQQIEEAYFQKNAINHRRQDSGVY
jgi:dimeric dUTPase (all-alpha-NTP-PPase superfamily)